jgi:hypothetical protein
MRKLEWEALPAAGLRDQIFLGNIAADSVDERRLALDNFDDGRHRCPALICIERAARDDFVPLVLAHVQRHAGTGHLLGDVRRCLTDDARLAAAAGAGVRPWRTGLFDWK